MELVLPKVTQPIANYLPYLVIDKMVYISGQLPLEEGKVKITGQLGDTVSIEEGQEAARLCAMNILAQLQAAAGSLKNVKRCIKLTGFINAIPEFTAHPQVMNGASDLMVKVFAEPGKHVRAAVGVSSLPLNAAVEVDAIFELM